MPDPLRILWEALESGGWQPQGPEHKFRANCPAHGGDSHQLRVNEGVDGRVLVYCHTNRCDAKSIVEAVGLTLRDLFPPGHPNARTVSPADDLETRGAAKKVAYILSALDEIDAPWQAMVTTNCQFCGAPGAWLRVRSGGSVRVDCPHGCSERAFTQGLSGKIELARADSALARRR